MITARVKSMVKLSHLTVNRLMPVVTLERWARNPIVHTFSDFDRGATIKNPPSDPAGCKSNLTRRSSLG